MTGLMRGGRPRSLLALAAAGMLAGPLAGCSSSPTPSAAPLTATTAAPATSSATPSASVSPSPTGSPSPSALSPFEADPAVRALRLHYVGLAKMVNARTDQVPELKQTSTPARFKILKSLFVKEFGDRYPGPIPFTPLSVSTVSGTRTKIAFCVLGDGWLRDAGTGKPTLPRKVQRGTATMVRVDGAWKVELAVQTPGSCAGVAIPEVLFP